MTQKVHRTKKINWTSLKLKLFFIKGLYQKSKKDNPQNGKKYLQKIYITQKQKVNNPIKNTLYTNSQKV